MFRQASLAWVYFLRFEHEYWPRLPVLLALELNIEVGPDIVAIIDSFLPLIAILMPLVFNTFLSR